MGGAFSKPKKGYEWSDKEISKCTVMTNVEARQWWSRHHMTQWKAGDRAVLGPTITVLDNQAVVRLVRPEKNSKATAAGGRNSALLVVQKKQE